MLTLEKSCTLRKRFGYLGKNMWWYGNRYWIAVPKHFTGVRHVDLNGFVLSRRKPFGFSLFPPDLDTDNRIANLLAVLPADLFGDAENELQDQTLTNRHKPIVIRTILVQTDTVLFTVK